LGYALGSAFRYQIAKHNQGHSPGVVRLLPAGHSHRRTSDGTAKPYVAYDV